MSDEEVKTKFKGPGQWRSQAQRLESDRNSDKKDTKKSQKSE
jgi:hypothetical protein